MNLFIPNPKEAESIHILREVAAQFERPVLLFSGGKDSITLVRLAQKAFFQPKSLSHYSMWTPDTISRRPSSFGIGW